MATRDWMSGLLSLWLVGSAIQCGFGGEPGKQPCGGFFVLQPLVFEDQTATATPQPASRMPTYKGRTCEQWVEEFRTELDPEERIVSLKALVVFGTNGRAEVVVPLILDVLDGYNVRGALMMAEAIDEGAEELQKKMSLGQLPEGFSQLGFSDVADLKLFFAANRGLVRLAPRATSVLVKYLEAPNALSPGRIGAMRAMAMEASKDWDLLVPKLVARDDFTAMIALHLWNSDELSVNSSHYETCVKELLALKSKGALIQVARTLAEPKHQSRGKVTAPLLEELLKTSTDEELREAVSHALRQIPRPATNKSQVVPASATEEKR